MQQSELQGMFLQLEFFSQALQMLFIFSHANFSKDSFQNRFIFFLQ